MKQLPAVPSDLWTRVGYFDVSEEAMKDHLSWVYAVMQTVIVRHVDYDKGRAMRRYTAWSPYFDPTDGDGHKYVATLHFEDNEHTVRWTRMPE